MEEQLCWFESCHSDECGHDIATDPVCGGYYTAKELKKMIKLCRKEHGEDCQH